MFAYCLNSPSVLCDPTGKLAFWGEIHNAVVRHIANKYGFYSEQYITFTKEQQKAFKKLWGRADLISPDGQVWDVKRDKTREITKGEKQVSQYVQGTWRDKSGTTLDIGGPEIECDDFPYESGYITYQVQYRNVGNGVIAYDYKMTEFDTKALVADAIGISISVGIGQLGGALFGTMSGFGTGAGGLIPVFP